MRVVGIHPPRDASAYREESTRTVKLLRSQVETARLWIEGVDQGRVPRAAASVALTEASTDAGRQASSYSSLDPAHSSSASGDRPITALMSSGCCVNASANFSSGAVRVISRRSQSCPAEPSAVAAAM